MVLLLVILFALLAEHSSWGAAKPQRRNDALLNILFLFIFLVFALRASSVGRDLPGYERMYEYTKSVPWNDFNYVYFENGYILLMKVCIAIGMSFQWFLAVVAAITLIPIYILIKKYSTDKCLSCLIYVTYIIFEFDLTGLRQAIAMSIVLLAIISLMEKKKWYILQFLLLVWVASQFHKSALIAIIVLPLCAIKNLKIFTAVIAAGTILSLALRNYLFQYIKTLFGKDTFSLSAGLYIGSNTIFMVALAAFFLLTLCIMKNNLSSVTDEEKYWLVQNELLYKIFLIGIMAAVFFGMETSARSFMYFAQAIIILLPNSTLGLTRRSAMLFKLVFAVFFVWFFYTNSLSSGGFDIVPYVFFWNQ